MKCSFALLTAFVVFAATDAFAGNNIWTGSGNNGNWTNSTNWGTNALNSADNITFGPTGTNYFTNTNNLTNNFSIPGITFLAGASNYVLVSAISTNYLARGAATLNAATNSLQTININMSNTAAALTTDTTNGATTVFGGILSGFAPLLNTLAGMTGTNVFLAANTFTNGLTNGQGVLRIANNLALGTTNVGTVISNGAALHLSNNISVGAEALSISGDGINSTGALRNVHGTNTYGGAITFTNNASIEADANTSLTLTNTIGGNFIKTFDGAGNVNVSGVISGTTNVVKLGAGTLELSAANSYTGDTIIGVGVARLSGSGSLDAASGVVVSNGATFDFNSISDTVDGVSGAGTVTLGSATLTVSNSATNDLSGTLSGSGGLIKVGAGTQILSGTTNSYGGTTTIGQGVLAVSTLANAGQNSSIGTNGTIIITNGGVLQYGGSTVSIDRNINLASGSGVIGVTNSATSLTIAGVISNTGSLVKTNAGELILTASNSYGGTTTVGAGALNIQNSAGLGATNSGTTVISGAALELEGGVTIGAEALALNGTGISAGGALRNISGNNTYGGTITNVTASRINSDAGTLTLSGAINATNLALTFGGAGSIAVDGAITNSTSTLTKDGAGTVTLSASNNYTGATTISAGALRAANSNALGTVAAGTTVASGAALELSGGITIGAETLGLSGTGTNAGGALRNISGANTYQGTITNTAASRINSDAGTLTLSGAINATNQALTFGGAGNIAANGAITNSTSTVTKDGAGTLTLAAANTYSGGTVINAGTVAISNAASFGSNTVTFASDNTTVAALAGVLFTNNIALTGNGTIDVGSFNLTNSGIISNTGSLTKAGAGTLILGRANTYTGGTTINAGTVAISNGASFGSNTVTFASNSTTVLALASVQVTNNTSLAGSGTMDVGAFILTNTGIISNTGSLTKAGAGTLILGRANTYTGGTTINAGTVAISNGASFGSNTVTFASNSTTVLALASVQVTNNYALTGNGTMDAGAFILTNSGAISGAGSLTKAGAGTMVLSGSNGFSGTTTVSAGVLSLGNTNALSGSTLDYSSAGTVSFGSLTGANLGGLQGSTNLVLTNTSGTAVALSVGGNDSSTTYSGALSGGGSLTKVGSGVLILTASNSYGGGTVLGGGTLQITNGNSVGSGSITFASGPTNSILRLQTGLTLTNSIVLNTNASQNNIFRATATPSTLSGSISGAGNLNLTGSGTNTFSASNSYTGVTTINAGELILGNTNALSGSTLNHNNAGVVTFGSLTGANLGGLQGATSLALTNATGAAVALNVGGNNSSTTYSGALSGAGGLTKSGAGTLTLSGANTYAGGTLVSAGALSGDSTSLQGNVTNNAAVIFDQSTNGTYAGVLSGTGSLAKNGAGTLILSASNSYSGGTLLSSGTLSAGNAFAFGSGSITLTNGTLLNLSNFSIANLLINNGGILTNLGTVSGAQLNGGTTTLSASNSTVSEVSGTATVNVSGNNTSITNVTGGTVAVSATNTTIATLTNTGVVTVTGANTSITNVGGGTLNVGANTAVQSYTGGNISISNATGVTVQSGNSAGSISGAGNLIKTGAGTLLLSGSNSYTGITTISNGVVSISINAALAGTTQVQMNNGTTLAYDGGSSTLDRAIAVTNGTGTIRNTGGGTLALSGSLSKNGTILRFNNGTFNVTGVISGASAGSDLIVDNANVTLSNANTYNGPTYIINGGTLTAAVAGAMPTNTRSAVIMDDTGTGGSALSVAANQQIASLAGTNTSTASIATNTSLTIGTTSGITTFAGVISGGGSLVKDGASTQTLTGANTYSGGTLVSGGVLSGSTTSLQGNITNNATLAFSQPTNGTYAGTMSGTGALTKNGTGILTLSSNNTFSGGTTVGEGELHVNSSGGLGSGSVNLTGTNALSLAALHYSNTATPLSIGALTLNGNAAIDLQALSSIQSTGAITINGTNNYISLGGANWNLGTNTLVSGTSLTLNGGSSILLTGTTLNEGTLGLGSTTNIGRSSFTFGSNATSFYLTTAGVAFDVVWTGAQNNLWNTNAANWQQTTNGLNPTGTNIAFATDDDVFFGNAATGNAITVDAGGVQAAQMYVTNSSGTVTFNGGSLSGHDLTKTGAGNLTISNTLALIGNDAAGPISGVFSNSGSGNVALAGAFTEGSLVQNGAGTMTLSGANSYAGGTLVAAGTLVGNTTSLQGSITNNAALVFNQSTTGTYAGILSGTGSLLKTNTGTLILTGANSQSSTAIGQGTLQIGNGGTTGSLSGAITNNGTLAYNRSDNITQSAAISGTGTLTKSGAGTLILSSGNTYSGGTTLSSGALRVDNTSALGTGALVQSDGTSTLQINAGGTVANNMALYKVAFLNGGNTLSGTITNMNTVYDVTAGTTNTLSGFVTGPGGLELVGGGVLAVTGATNNYGGATTISNGTLRVGTLANAGSASSIGTNSSITLAGSSAASAVLDYTGGNTTIDRALALNNGGGTINMASAATTMTMTGSASGSGSLVLGEGRMVLSNTGTPNSFAPASIQVDSGATLQLAASNQIGNSTGLILNGGTFIVGTATAGYSETLGTLTLSASSTIDLGSYSTGLRTLTFANSSAITWVGTLTITNWQGMTRSSSDVAEILFGTGGLTTTQLGQIYFANQDINGGTLAGTNGELVPIPEAEVYWGALAIVLAVAYRERRRLIAILRQVRR